MWVFVSLTKIYLKIFHARFLVHKILQWSSGPGSPVIRKYTYLFMYVINRVNVVKVMLFIMDGNKSN